MLPPRPPAPPSCPPMGTYFSRRKCAEPSPPLPASTLIFARSKNCIACLWWAQQGSNLRLTGYEPAALPLSYGPRLVPAQCTTSACGRLGTRTRRPPLAARPRLRARLIPPPFVHSVEDDRMPYPIIRLKPGRERPILAGHPWIFSGALATVDENIPPGAIVYVVSARDDFVARGSLNAANSLALRILTRDPNEAIDQAFFDRRFGQAASLRSGL